MNIIYPDYFVKNGQRFSQEVSFSNVFLNNLQGEKNLAVEM